MSRIIGISIILCALADLTIQASTPDSPFYVAGVVELTYSKDNETSKRIQENLANYVKFIGEAKKEELDIIVFPEATLNGGSKDRMDAEKLAVEVPDPAKNVVPCSLTKEDILSKISCAAKESEVYVVINLSEQQPCSPNSQDDAKDSRPCGRDAKHFYNTDVVFDRKGAVIARYRKFHLFSESHFNTTVTAERITFYTDFGVRFGLFTCFDILFKDPALDMVREMDIKDFVFPTMWFSEMPFLTALQVQEYWAQTNDVNLLAAGASNPSVGSGGSGIYAGVYGPLASFISVPGKESENSKLLIAKVQKLRAETPPIKSRSLYSVQSRAAADMDAFKMLRDGLKVYTSELIGETFSKELCSEDLCCSFNVTSHFLNSTAGKVSYQYRAIVADKVRSFSGVTTGGIKSCAVVACSGSELSTCAQRFNDSSKVEPHQIFQSIHVEGKFPAIDEVMTMPTTLTHSMRPLVVGSFKYFEDRRGDDDEKHVSISSRGLGISDLQTFGIYGRDFRRDGQKESSASTVQGSFSILLAVTGYCFMKFIFDA